MERNSRPNKKPTPSQIVRRQTIGAALAMVALVGGAKGVSEAWNHSNDGAKAKTELVAKSSEQKAEQKVITIGPDGLFPNLSDAVLDIASQNSKLNSEDIRQILSDELKAQLADLGVPMDEYNQFQPVEEVTLAVPTDWGVGESVQSDSGTP